MGRLSAKNVFLARPDREKGVSKAGRQKSTGTSARIFKSDPGMRQGRGERERGRTGATKQSGRRRSAG